MTEEQRTEAGALEEKFPRPDEQGEEPGYARSDVFCLCDEKGNRIARDVRTPSGELLRVFPMWLGLYLQIENREEKVKDWTIAEQTLVLMRCLDRPNLYRRAVSVDKIEETHEAFTKWCLRQFDPVTLGELVGTIVNASTPQRVQSLLHRLREIRDQGGASPSPVPNPNESSSIGSTGKATRSGDPVASTG